MIYRLEDMDESEVMTLNLTNVSPSLYYHESKWFKPVVDKLLAYVPEKERKAPHIKAVKWFVTQSSRAVKAGCAGFYVFLHHSQYKNSPLGVGHKPVMNILSTMEQAGYIDIYIGFADFSKEVVAHKQQSFVHLTEKGRQLWESVESRNIPKLKLEDVVEIRDRETKSLQTTQGIKGVKEVREQVTNLNATLANTVIAYKGMPLAPTEYKRVFTDNLYGHGRFYVAGGGVQLLPAIYRSEYLTFDGEKVVELDFSSLHPNLLYEQLEATGEYKPLEGDGGVKEILGESFKPYDADISHLVNVDEALVQSHKEKYALQSYDPVRNLLKLALLISLNSIDRNQAGAALRAKLQNDKHRTEEYREFVGLDTSLMAWKVCDAVKEHNYLIEDYFYKDIGFKLMNKDSNIASSVVEKLLNAEEPVLIYHDSFIVRESNVELLYNAMKEAWGEEMGSNKFCKIEKK